MDFQLQRDDTNRQVLVTVNGNFSIDEASEILEQCRAQGIGSYSLLYDLRGLTGTPTIDDAKRYFGEELTKLGIAGRGPIAVLVTDAHIYNVACGYSALAHGKLAVGVFRDREAAETWLQQRYSSSEH